MNKINWKIGAIAIICLTIMECFAMHYGINGTMRTIIFTIIAAIAGLTINTKSFLKE